jgi:putative FmdB family regulatory protein
MPTYDYQCLGCNHKFEEWQSFSDPVLKKCPKCKKNKLERLIGTGAGFVVRGGTLRHSDVTGMREVPMDSAEQKLAERMAEMDNQ